MRLCKKNSDFSDVLNVQPISWCCRQKFKIKNTTFIPQWKWESWSTKSNSKENNSPTVGLEPTTTRLKAGRSTDWATSVLWFGCYFGLQQHTCSIIVSLSVVCESELTFIHTLYIFECVVTTLLSISIINIYLLYNIQLL